MEDDFTDAASVALLGRGIGGQQNSVQDYFLCIKHIMPILVIFERNEQ
jgi:hypothetical protein